MLGLERIVAVGYRPFLLSDRSVRPRFCLVSNVFTHSRFVASGYRPFPCRARSARSRAARRRSARPRFARRVASQLHWNDTRLKPKKSEDNKLDPDTVWVPGVIFTNQVR